jgi:hypothetical protein
MIPRKRAAIKAKLEKALKRGEFPELRRKELIYAKSSSLCELFNRCVLMYAMRGDVDEDLSGLDQWLDDQRSLSNADRRKAYIEARARDKSDMRRLLRDAFANATKAS